MDVDYELTPEDLYAYHGGLRTCRQIAGARAGEATFIYSSLFFSSVFCLRPDLVAFDSHASICPRSSRCLRSSPVSIGYLCAEDCSAQSAKQIAKERPEKGQLGAHRIVLSSEGIDETTVVGHTLTRRSASIESSRTRITFSSTRRQRRRTSSPSAHSTAQGRQKISTRWPQGISPSGKATPTSCCRPRKAANIPCVLARP